MRPGLMHAVICRSWLACCWPGCTAILADLTAQRAPIAVPDGGYSLVNGMIGSGEWNNAASYPLDPETRLRAKKDQHSLFLAIVFEGPHHTGVDIYLKSSGTIRMLHVSSALGEREFQEGQWSEMRWGTNTWWTANPVNLIIADGTQRPLAPEAFEFQLNRGILGSEIDLYLNLKRPDKRLPIGASEVPSKEWLRLSLD